MQYITLILIGSHSNLRHQNKPFSKCIVLSQNNPVTINIVSDLLIEKNPKMFSCDTYAPFSPPIIEL